MNRELLKEINILSGWTISEDKKSIKKSFKFLNFIEAFTWMFEVSMVSEKTDHHPEWLNIYNKVDVKLSTHDKNAVTELDVNLAKFMDKSYERFIK